MNGVHDLGGMHGFGRVTRERDEPVFHAEWERRMFGLALALMGGRYFNVDEFRRTIERMPPVEYLAASYYQRWLYALERLLVEKGALGDDEIETALMRAEANVPDPSGAVLAAMAEEAAHVIVGSGGGTDASLEDTPAGGPSPASANVMPRRRDRAVGPRFKVGDRVIARNINPEGHTRLPRYARGHRGVVRHDWGVFAFPDTHAHGLGANPRHCYCVSFTARELWGGERPPGETVHIDLWEDYLEPAPAAIEQPEPRGAATASREAKRVGRRPRAASLPNRRRVKSNEVTPPRTAKSTGKRQTGKVASKSKTAKNSVKKRASKPKPSAVSRNKR